MLNNFTGLSIIWILFGFLVHLCEERLAALLKRLLAHDIDQLEVLRRQIITLGLNELS